MKQSNTIAQAILQWLQTKQSRLLDLKDRVLASLWLRPLIWLGGFTLLAGGLVYLESYILETPNWDELSPVLLSQPDGARTMLGAIAGALLTAVSLSFSLMMGVVMQTANAYTPRLLRQYIGDTHNHHVLGIFMGGFTYSILILRSVQSNFVPHIAVNVALLLSIVCIIALISFINHVATSIEVGNIIKLIEKQALGSLDSFDNHDVGDPFIDDYTLPESPVCHYHAPTSGYIRTLQLKGFEQFFDDEDFLAELHYSVGDYVLEGSILVTLWRGEQSEALDSTFEAFLALGNERSWNQDPRYGFNQLTDIALKALSPGINDPTTAVMALNSIAKLMRDTLQRGNLEHALRADEGGTLRLICPPNGIERIVRESLWLIFDYGYKDHTIATRLIQVLGELGEVAPQQNARELFTKTLSEMHQRMEIDAWSELERRAFEDVYKNARRRLKP